LAIQIEGVGGVVATEDDLAAAKVPSPGDRHQTPDIVFRDVCEPSLHGLILFQGRAR
jgi:hypothetical protein